MAVMTTLCGFLTARTRTNRDEQAFIAEIAKLTRLTNAASDAVDILPGMEAQVDILSRKRTVLDYLIALVVRVKEITFRTLCGAAARCGHSDRRCCHLGRIPRQRSDPPSLPSELTRPRERIC